MEAPMEPFRLKLKVGLHEFEAEGDQETVERQLAIWRELIATPGMSASPLPREGGPVGPATAPNEPTAKYAKIFRHQGRVVSLSVQPNGDRRNADAALLVILGQRLYNGTDLVSGGQIIDGLDQSGITGVERANVTLGD